MAKRKEEIENRIITPVIPLRRPSIDQPSRLVTTRCESEICQDHIDTFNDDYIVIDDMLFCSDKCVTDFFIKSAGGRRVHGGAC
jgi:hypothetical protein